MGAPHAPPLRGALHPRGVDPPWDGQAGDQGPRSQTRAVSNPINTGWCSR